MTNRTCVRLCYLQDFLSQMPALDHQQYSREQLSFGGRVQRFESRFVLPGHAQQKPFEFAGYTNFSASPQTVHVIIAKYAGNDARFKFVMVRAGGITEPANGRALCPRCNLVKGGRPA